MLHYDNAQSLIANAVLKYLTKINAKYIPLSLASGYFSVSKAEEIPSCNAFSILRTIGEEDSERPVKNSFQQVFED